MVLLFICFYKWENQDVVTLRDEGTKPEMVAPVY